MKIFPPLTAVTPLSDYKLALTFGENENRLYDFKPNLSHKYYSVLVDIKLFNSVSVVNGEIKWITGQDFCPHTLFIKSVPHEA